jgi:hypothetical protein
MRNKRRRPSFWRWPTIFGRVRRAWRYRPRRATTPRYDADAVEISRAEALIGRLEIAAMIGHLGAAAQLERLADDPVEAARKRLAKEALERLGYSKMPVLKA